MSVPRKFRHLVLLGLAVVIILTAAGILAFTVYSQEQALSTLNDRLKHANVPVKSVTISSTVPFKIEITLQSQSNDNHFTLDDNWNMTLARREAVAIYKLGYQVRSYSLVVVNAKGEIISSSEIFTLGLNKVSAPSIDNTTVANIVLRKLFIGSLTVNKVDVFSDEAISSSGQILNIILTAPDLETANRSWDRLYGSLMSILGTVNKNNGAAIILCHLTILDEQGNILMNYIHDNETGITQWGQAAGFTKDWFPHPVDTLTATTPTAIPVRTLPPYAYPPLMNPLTPTLPGYPGYPFPLTETPAP